MRAFETIKLYMINQPFNAVGKYHELLPTGPNKEWKRTNGLPARKLSLPEEIDTVRKIVARVYLEEGYIGVCDIDDSTGHIDSTIDPYVNDSEYFGYNEGNVVTTGRLISLDVAKYPALTEFGVKYEDLLKLGLSSDPKDYAEISALAKYKKHKGKDTESDDDSSKKEALDAKDRFLSDYDEMLGRMVGYDDSSKKEALDDKYAVLHIYAQMFRSAIESGKKYFLMSVDIKLTKRLWQLFGRKNFIEIAEPREYMGSTTVPMAMNIGEALKLLDKHIPRYIKSIFIENLKGLDASRIDPEYQDVLYRHGIIQDKPDYEKENSNFGNKAVVLGAAGLALYSGGKYGSVIETAGMQTGLTFAAVDLSSITPYLMGVKRAIEAESFSDRKAMASIGVVAVSFATPYLYLWSQLDNVSEDNKGFIIAGLATIATIGAGSTVRKLWNSKKAKT